MTQASFQVLSRLLLYLLSQVLLAILPITGVSFLLSCKTFYSVNGALADTHIANIFPTQWLAFSFNSVSKSVAL